MRALIFTLLAACASEPMAIDDMTCPPAGTTLTYDNFGADFLGSYCNHCHADAREGAPSSYKFNSLADVDAHRDRIFIRAAGPNVTMPPGPDDPPQATRNQRPHPG